MGMKHICAAAHVVVLQSGLSTLMQHYSLATCSKDMTKPKGRMSPVGHVVGLIPLLFFTSLLSFVPRAMPVNTHILTDRYADRQAALVEKRACIPTCTSGLSASCRLLKLTMQMVRANKKEQTTNQYIKAAQIRDQLLIDMSDWDEQTSYVKVYWEPGGTTNILHGLLV